MFRPAKVSRFFVSKGIAAELGARVGHGARVEKQQPVLNWTVGDFS